MRRLFWLFALFAFMGNLPGQVSTGTITGVVTDTSGGSIPEAEIRITNQNTGAVRSLTTQVSGAYVARNLPLGNYRVEAQFTGFQPEVKTGIVLTIDQTLTLNFTLQPGGQQEVVTVVARSEQLVEAATSSLGQAIEETEIRNLPLNGRNYRQLIALTAGAVPAVQGVFTAGNYYMSGGRGDANAFLLDGLDISQFSTGGPLTSINLEAVGEFKVITNSYSAEYGRTLSGVVTASVKGGTNEFHGSLFEFFRNRTLDARNFFANEKPKYHFNQFGSSIGGPIAKNKLFVFGDYQGTRIRSGGPRLVRIPTPTMRSGDFSENAAPVHDPLSTNPDTLEKTPFPDNVVPQARFDRPSAVMFGALPEPNEAGVLNYRTVAGQQDDSNSFDIRTDFYATQADRVGFVLTYSDQAAATDSILPRLSGHLLPPAFSAETRTASLNWTRVMGTAMVNELILGVKRFARRGTRVDGYQYEPDLGVPHLNLGEDDLFATGFPMYIIPGFNFFGGPAGGPYAQIHNIPQLTNNFSISKGNHSIKLGGGVRFRQFNLGQSVWPRGLFVFLSLPTSSKGAGGDSVASALLGYPFNAVRDFTPPYGERLHEYGFYLQDDWKVTRRLTLNLGIRWDLYPPAFERHDRLANYDLQQGVMTLANQNGQSRSTLTTNRSNFSPRLGFAYQLTSDGKTVVRGGFAMGYLLQQTSAVGTANERLTANLPFKRNFAQVFDFNSPSHRVSDGLFFPDPDPTNPNGDVNFLLRGDPTPYMEQWNFNLQRALPWNFMGEVSYVGSHGVHLSGNANLNQAPPGPTASGPRSIYDPNLNSITSILSRQSSIYHALQAKLQRRFADGLYLVASYTFSKSIDDGSFTSSAAGAGSSSGPQNAYNWRAERGPSDFDVTHRFVGSYVYELPWGRGRKFMTSAPNALEMILGGWQINGITTVQSGGRFTPSVANPRTNAGPGGSIRPDRIGSGKLSGGARMIQKWFDRSAFVPQGSDGSDPYHFGNSGRNILRGPGLVNFDFSLFKKFSIKEKAAVEVRGEFFSLFNTPRFDLPNRSVDVPQGGVISSAQAARQVQLALRLTF